MNYNIELSGDTIDQIIVDTLSNCIADWESDLEKDIPMVFMHDAQDDKKEIRKHIKSARRIIEYFTV
jgi:hypothetical protein